MLTFLELQGALPFAGLPAWNVVAVFGVYVFSFFVRGAIGFGSAMPAVVLTSWLLPAHHAVILALLAGLVSQTQFIAQGIRDADWTVTRSVSLALVVSVTIGVLLFERLESEWLLMLLGLTCLGLVSLGQLPIVHRIVAMWGSRAGVASGFVSGFVGSVVGAGGMYLLVVYLREVCTRPATLRATNIVVSAVFLVWRTVVAALAGLVSLQILSEVMVLIPAIVFGGWLGARLFRKLDAVSFGRLVQAVLLVASVGLVIRGGVAVWSTGG